MAYKAAVRAGSLKTVGAGKQSISAAESHAKRLDPVAQSRVVSPRDPIAWSKAEGDLDYVEAFQIHKRETGASERKGADLAMEFKLVVSPEWLAEVGDPHDPDNERVGLLFEEAKAWAESWGGKGAVWAVRYDTDERGAGVVDVFMSPVREQRHKTGKTKTVISCRKAKEELLEAERVYEPELKTSGAAMQSSWARWCGQFLDSSIERGVSKETTGREHIHADVYAREVEAAREKAAREVAEANKAVLEAQGKLKAVAAALDALEAWEEHRISYQTPQERHAEAREQWALARSQQNRDAMTKWSALSRQAAAEMGTIIRLDQFNPDTGEIVGTNVRTREIERARLPVDPLEYFRLFGDHERFILGHLHAEKGAEMLRNVLKNCLEKIGKTVSLAGLSILANGERIVRSFPICDPPRPELTERPPVIAKPVQEMPADLKEQIRQALTPR